MLLGVVTDVVQARLKLLVDAEERAGEVEGELPLRVRVGEHGAHVGVVGLF